MYLIDLDPRVQSVMTKEHSEKLITSLKNWHDSMPEEIIEHISVVQTASFEEKGECSFNFYVEVALFGTYQHYSENDVPKQDHWGKTLNQLLLYSATVEEYYVDRWLSECTEGLTRKLRQALQAEINTHQLLTNELNSKIEKLSVHY